MTIWGIHNDQPDIDPLAEGRVRIDYGIDVDLREIEGTREAIRSLIDAEFPEKSAGAKAQEAGVLFRFSHEIQVDDVIVAPNRYDSTISIGTVSGPYEYLDDVGKFQHAIPVSWKRTRIPRSEFSQSTLNTLGSLIALFQVANGSEEIIDLFDGAKSTPREPNFDWIPFYEELAEALLSFRQNRASLMDRIDEVARRSGKARLFDYLKPKNEVQGLNGRLYDIDPFTVFSPFNRATTTTNRLRIAEAYREVFEISSPAPTGFDGIPLLNNMSSWFMHFSDDNGGTNVDALWDLAEAAINYSKDPTPEAQESLVSTFDAARRSQTARLTMGLFYIRPQTLVSFDSQNVAFLRSHFPSAESNLVLKNTLTGDEYLANLQAVNEWIQHDSASPNSIAEMSFAAFTDSPAEPDIIDDTPQSEPIDNTFDVARIIEDGSFLSEERLSGMLETLSLKKNIILQGPPGTGKTWLARRLAWAFIGEKEPDSLLVMQFHPSMSYEDFVRGYRPSSAGGLELVDGPFLQMAQRAHENPNTPFVVIIEEINRGNPAQIFGEMLTLMEHTKRTANSAMQLTYPRDGEQYYLPSNLYIIGTMNLADRSLAIVDMAFRRRFAFHELEPEIGQAWLEYTSGLGYNREVLSAFAISVAEVNEMIVADSLLGPQMRIGHSYLVPRVRAEESESIEETTNWLASVCSTEIMPLLQEYWFDNPAALADARTVLHRAL